MSGRGRWWRLRDAQVEVDGRAQSLFDVLEDTDSGPCLARMQAIAPQRGAASGVEPYWVDGGGDEAFWGGHQMRKFDEVLSAITWPPKGACRWCADGDTSPWSMAICGR